jgi:hypothetical protein
VTTNLPGSGGRLSRQLWLVGLVPLTGLVVAGGRWLRRLSGGAGRPDPGRGAAVALCLVLLALVVVMSVANLWVRWRYLGVLGVSTPSPALAAVVSLLLAGVALQALALWRLRPPTGGRVAGMVAGGGSNASAHPRARGPGQTPGEGGKAIPIG